MVEVLAYIGMQATGSGTPLAQRHIHAMHAIHIRAGTTQIAQIAFPLGQILEDVNLAQDILLGARSDLLALVRRDGAEATSSEAPAVHTYREANHLIGRDMLALVLRVRMILEWQVVDRIQFVGGHRRVRWIDHYVLITHRLYDSRCGNFIALGLDESEVLGMHLFATEGSFMGVK